MTCLPLPLKALIKLVGIGQILGDTLGLLNLVWKKIKEYLMKYSECLKNNCKVLEVIQALVFQTEKTFEDCMSDALTEVSC